MFAKPIVLCDDLCQAWCEVGRASTPAGDTPCGDLEGDDWLGSSSHVGTSEATEPVPPSHSSPPSSHPTSHPSRTFQQNLRSVQELSEEAASTSGA